MHIIMTLEITEIRPEKMRVIFKSDSLYHVQTYSEVTSIWTTQKTYSMEYPAILDCATWYK